MSKFDALGGPALDWEGGREGPANYKALDGLLRNQLAVTYLQEGASPAPFHPGDEATVAATVTRILHERLSVGDFHLTMGRRARRGPGDVGVLFLSPEPEPDPEDLQAGSAG